MATHANRIQASSARSAAVRAMRGAPVIPATQQTASVPAIPALCQHVSPVPAMSATQQVSYLENHLAQFASAPTSTSASAPSSATANAPSNEDCCTGYAPGELSAEELWEVYSDNLTADILLENDNTGV